MRINTNLNAMKAIKNSNKNVSSSGNSMKKLISGLSINKAADDAVLCDAQTGIIFNINIEVAELGIKNGSQLMLI